MKKKVLIALSYIATAIVTCGLTIFLIQRQIPSTKLITLENLILELFPNEVDRTEMEDAAADAMVAALGIAGAIIFLPANMTGSWNPWRTALWASESH